MLPSQSNGIEDARFVEFDAGGSKTSYATYTAYTGRSIRSELLETSDFAMSRSWKWLRYWKVFRARLRGRMVRGNCSSADRHLAWGVDLSGSTSIV